MSTIIAGGFQVHEDAERAMARLREAGVMSDEMCTFRVNPPGEHQGIATGGDHDKSPGAGHADGGSVKGAVVGAAAGAVAGVAISPLLGPVAIAGGAAVGAYTGSLVGALGSMDPQTHKNHVRPAETLVAVNADGVHVAEAEIVRILSACGAQQVERSEGMWRNGEWVDFDPVSAPHLVYQAEGRRPLPPA